MSFKQFGRVAALLAVCLAALVLAACGGGGSSGSSVLGGSTGISTPMPASLQIKFSAASVDNTGTQPLTATITALDASGRGLAGVPLTISIDSHATYAVSGTTGLVTTADGTVKADVTIGTDLTPRTVTMKVQAGAIASSQTFDVVASKQIAAAVYIVASNDQIQNSFGNTSTVTVTAVDGNQNALPNIPITFTVGLGNTIVPAGTVTGANGTLTGIVGIGSDQSNRDINVTATSGTFVAKKTLRVVGTKLTASAFAPTVSAGAKNNLVSFLLVDNTGRKMSGYDTILSISGQSPDQKRPTNADGEVTFSYDAGSSPGTLTLTATAAGVSDVESVSVSTIAKVDDAIPQVLSASVSASPNVVTVNPPSAPAANKTEIRALFLSKNNAPVKNVRVWFDLNGNQQSIGGTLASTAGHVLLYSDANGIARTTYAPDARFSPKDGIVIRVCWAYQDFDIPAEGGVCPIISPPDSPPPAPFSPAGGSALTTLTAVSDSLSVSIGTSNEIGTGTSKLTYTVRYAVQVVDSAGQAKVGVKVSPSIDLLQYYKGEWQAPSGAIAWIQGGRGNRYPGKYPSVGSTEGYPGALPTGKSVPAIGLLLFADTLTIPWAMGNVSICDNEDLNRNGVSELFQDFISSMAIPSNFVPEDQNNSFNLSTGRPALDPRKADVTISVEGNDTTDSNGIVVVKIEYPQNIGSWVYYNILVAASGVAGTEGRANFSALLPVPAVVVNNVKADPPFRLSPYGISGTDTYLRKNAQGQSGWLCTYAN